MRLRNRSTVTKNVAPSPKELRLAYRDQFESLVDGGREEEASAAAQRPSWGGVIDGVAG